jgi:peptidoglycan hydrolase-like protein with peptidoglycan-binding domain
MKLEIVAAQLSLGLQGDDVARLHQMLLALGRDIPLGETDKQVVGPGTVAVVKAVQADSRLPVTGIVDAKTIKAINAALAESAKALRTVRGHVRTADGTPATGLTVQIYLQGPSGEKALGKTALDTDGAYEISYQPNAKLARIDLRIEVCGARTAVETTPPGLSILTNAGRLEVVDFILTGAASAPTPEFSRVLADIKPLIGTRNPAELEEASLLGVQSGRAPAQVAALVIASRIAGGTKIPSQVFYALLREGLPADLKALQATHPDVLKAALASAVGKGIVPDTVGGKKIDAYLSGLAPTPDARLKRLLGNLLKPAEMDLFVRAYLESGDDPAKFWKGIAADATLSDRAAKLKLAAQVAGLTESHEPLVAKVLARNDITQAADLACLTTDQWKALVQAGDVGVPAGTPGANAEDQANHYVNGILGRVEAAFPTQFFAARLGNIPVGSFLATNPAFQLKSTSLTKYLNDNPAAALNPEEKKRLQGYQRLYRLTSRADETQLLSAKGIDSAQKISASSREMFAEQHRDIFTAERAAQVHDRALQVSAMALAVFNENAAALNRTGLQALPRVDSETQALLAANSIPDWQSLFGTFDACACEDCASVHSAAAYFVDILHFLDDRGARQPLFERRPDLGDIELSCANTNTPLPLVDLVNEILEDTVVPPAVFAPFVLAPALEADLAQPAGSEALTAAFSPPLAAGSRVEVLEPATRWRIWDEAFAYSVVKEGAALNVATRSRQATGSAAERRATPQYQTSAAYDELNRSVFPWRLPFDLPAAEARVFLEHLGVPRRDLIEALRPLPDPFDANAPVVMSLAAEGLGLSDTERKIIVDEPLTPPVVPEDFWGGAQLADLSTVQPLLDRAGLSYAELEALLATQFVNPGATVTIAPDPDALDSCDTTRLHLDGLTADVLNRLQRFVRLWRKLGWKAAALDKAICALSPDPNVPVLTNEVLVRLDHVRVLCAQLRLTGLQVLALWRPIDTAEPDSLYQSLFYNPAVFKPQNEDFRLRVDGQDLVHTNKLLADHASALQAAFRLDSSTVALLAAKTDGALNLANLSLIYRHASVALQLRLTVPSLLTAIELTGIDPFQVDHTEDTLRFVNAVTEIQKSGFDIAWLDYLLQQQFSSAASFVPTNITLAQILTDVRAALLKADAPTAEEKQKLQQSAAIDRMAAALGLAGDITGNLLGRVKHNGTAALQVSLALLSIDPAQPLTRANAQPQFETLEKLLKIAHVIKTLELPASQLDWLFREMSTLATAPDPQATPIPFASWFSLIQLGRLQRDLALEAAATEAVLGALTAIAGATDAPGRIAAKTGFVNVLSTWMPYPLADLETLIGKANNPGDLGLFAAQFPGGFRIDLLSRLNRAMSRLKRLGAKAAAATLWCESSVSNANAKAIRDAAKSKYDDAAWQTTVTPLQDALRDQQREALVAYLAARPAKWGSALATANADDLYTHFLIDVQMCSCQLTSRIKQAIGSVQLYVQRCLMGLESGVLPSDPLWKRWNRWMKNYRVWEANRKIWLYPENWIEPELRDDKSPFFKDLESELLQSDLDNDAAEQALMRYLEKLHEVGQLEIAGTYEDDDRNLHVFGRTFHTPRVYFYRRKDSATATWTAWEKLDVDIEGDHLIPVFWNRKLMLIWPVFTLKQDEKPTKMPPAGESLESGTKHWEIQLAWSEYQYGRWSGKYLSDPVRFDAYLGVPNILFGDYHARPVAMARQISTDPGSTPPPVFPLPPTPPGGGTGPAPATGPLTPVPPDFVTFKAFASPTNLRVRCYLRLDYTGAGAGPAFAYPFGEFRFAGCRKVVTSAHRSQMSGLDFALAVKSTAFDRIWLDGVASGLTLLDGTFVTRPSHFDETILADINEPQPLPEDASATIAKRIDIPVLGGTPSAYKLLAPHQDPQFLADRPFFYMDLQRVFIVSSTGSSHLVTNPFNWVVGDLATLGLATAARLADDDTPEAPPAVNTAVTVLMPGPIGTRVARQLSTFNLAPTSALNRIFPRFWSDRAYTFKNFHHAYVCQFVQTFDRSGIDALLSLDTQSLANPQSFDAYLPTTRVTKEYPIDDVEFRTGGAYELYNWELFFHIPLLIATRLSSNQRFEEAQRWFHYIFDPTGSAGGDPPQPYWRTKPFHDRLSVDYEKESVESIEKLATVGAPEELVAAVKMWRDHPFDPYAVARLRTTAFQKTVVMKYLDNLIAWGDQRFRGETIESINEATLLYVLAGEILGRRPEKITRKVQPAVQTFNSLTSQGPLSNAMEQIELLIANADSTDSSGSSEIADPPKVLYFCVQENDKLLGYWNTVADRQFKIRHCMNIEGQVRQLPLFEPPIDPALLVRAAAAGIDLASVMSDREVPLSHYRFTVMLQKAAEFCGDVKALGAALLLALEKKDAEQLALLRSGQEVNVLKAVRQVKQYQLDEARSALEALRKYQEIVTARQQFYLNRPSRNEFETRQLERISASIPFLQTQEGAEALAAILCLIPGIKTGAPTTLGATYGGDNLGPAAQAYGAKAGANASMLNTSASLSATLGSFERRQDDWDHQADLATRELEQVQKQIAGAQIRVAIAENELRNHGLQIDNATAIDDVMRGKFTNENLYQWMVGQVSGIYFQSYQLAYDLAKRAERCMQHELGLAYGETSYIRFGYWDSLKKGLLAGDLLAHDLKRLDAAYLDRNLREYELTKHVSLLALAPEQLIALKEAGTCEFTIPEWLFDLDTPGHYRRRLKMVNVTIPCVAGPYVGIHCKAQLLKSSYRQNVDVAPGYERLAADDPGNPDNRFIDDRKILEAIVTSTAQNDAGLFEPSMRDERFLPFEGAGAISTWRLDLPKEFEVFNYDTISDVIFHLHYTAREDETLRGAASTAVQNLLATASVRPLLRMFSLRHEFPGEWYRFVNSPASAETTMTVDLGAGRFPYFAQGREITISGAKVLARSKSAAAPEIAIAPGTTLPASSNSDWTGQQDPGSWTVGTSADPKSIEDVFVVLAYTV